MKLLCFHIADDGRCIRAQLHPVSVWITMVYPFPRLVIDAVLIHHAGLCLLRYKLPEIPVMHFLHGTFCPPVELADHGNPGRRRGKCAEYYFLPLNMRAQIFVCVKNFSCVKSIEIHNFPPVNRQQLLFVL